MAKTTETVLEINLDHLAHNYTYLKGKLKPDTRFLGVVKAFAYGSDAVRVASKLEAMGVDYLAVAYTKEGVLLREAGITVPILVLHPQAARFEQLIAHQLEPSLYAPKIFRAFLATAETLQQRQYPVHIKFNTGLNRLGFWENDIDYIQQNLSGCDAVKIVSLFSHLAASEDLNERDFTLTQIATFTKIAKEFDSKITDSAFKHMANTSGIINYPEAQFDMVRSGIGLYGFGNDAKTDAALRPVATLKTIISQIHKIEPGESVGYNRAFVSEGYQITATLPLGHADGIGRHYGNGKTYVQVHGKKAPIIGNVCMDMIMIDITHVGGCKEGDEVILFGEGVSTVEFASASNTISYELLSGISQRVSRRFIES